MRYALAAVLLLMATIALAIDANESQGGGRSATTTLLSRSVTGGTPNGASTKPVISADLRYSQIVAFESVASNIVRDDTNGVKDVFAVRRAGSFSDNGSRWNPGATQLVSRGPGDVPANGPSFDASVDGNAKTRAKCVAFLSDATNLVSDDTNGQTDAFLARAPNFQPTRVSLPSNAQATGDTTHVAVAGDCSRVAFVTDGKLFVRTGNSTRAISHSGAASDPSFDVGDTASLVFGAGAGAGSVYLLEPGKTKGSSVAPGGRNPGYINRRQGGRAQRYVVYEKKRGRVYQIYRRKIGSGERVISAYKGTVGNKNSRNPSIFNRGVNATFESDATNLPIKVSGERGDKNGRTDAYFWTETRNSTILETVNSSNDQFTAGGTHPSTSYYRNYVVFDSAANNRNGAPQIYMRYLGGI
jgi:hypothetical protein